MVDQRVLLGLGALSAIGAVWWLASSSGEAPAQFGALAEPTPGQPGTAPQPLKLPALPFPPTALAPLISEKTVRAHRVLQKRYVEATNRTLAELHNVRQQQLEPVLRRAKRRALATSLAYDLGGAYLHDLYWRSMAPQGRGGAPTPQLAAQIQRDFGSIGMLAQELTDVGDSMQGSGWAVLAWSPYLQRLAVFGVGETDNSLPPGVAVVLPIDVWEHAYYLDRGPNRGAYLRQFWGLVNWAEISRRFGAMVGQRAAVPGAVAAPGPAAAPKLRRQAAPAQAPAPAAVEDEDEDEDEDELGGDRRRMRRQGARDRARKRQRAQQVREAVQRRSA